jgi:hypothetical protein
MNTLRSSARDIYRNAKKCGASQAKEAYLKKMEEKNCGTLFIEEFENVIIDDILRNLDQPNFDHDTIDLCINIFNLDIKRDYLAQFCEQNLPNVLLNNPTRQLIKTFKKCKNGRINECFFRDSDHDVLHEQ